MAVATSTALIMGGAALAGGAMSANATKKGAKAQRAGQAEASALQRDMFEQSRNDMTPWREVGGASLAETANMLGLGEQPYDYSELTKTPNYLFQQQEGMKGIDRAMAKSGMNGSGQQLKAISEFNNNLAGNTFNTRLQQLAQLAGVGQNASQWTGNAGMNTAANMGNLAVASGQSQADKYVNQANAFNNTINQGAGLFAMSNFNTPASAGGGYIAPINVPMGGYGG